MMLSAFSYSYYMMTSSNGNIFRVTGHLCGEFTGPGESPAQRPVTRSFDVFFHLRLNQRLSKQPWGWWFETPAWSLWRRRNEMNNIGISRSQIASTRGPATNMVQLPSQHVLVITLCKVGMTLRYDLPIPKLQQCNHHTILVKRAPSA